MIYAFLYVKKKNTKKTNHTKKPKLNKQRQDLPSIYEDQAHQSTSLSPATSPLGGQYL